MQQTFHCGHGMKKQQKCRFCYSHLCCRDLATARPSVCLRVEQNLICKVLKGKVITQCSSCRVAANAPRCSGHPPVSHMLRQSETKEPVLVSASESRQLPLSDTALSVECLFMDAWQWRLSKAKAFETFILLSLKMDRRTDKAGKTPATPAVDPASRGDESPGVHGISFDTSK